MPLITCREALNQAMAEELERDPNVVLMGEEIGQFHGAYKVTEGLLARFGPKRDHGATYRRQSIEMVTSPVESVLKQALREDRRN